MSVTIHEVLGDLRSTALDTRDQGDKFERLMHSYLRTDPEWTAKFTDVWLWSDWPERGNRPDTGIDLVAKNRDDDRYTAIQCKFYAADSTVAKKDIDSFLSASGRVEFSQRYIFDTAKSWSKNATDTIEGMSVPVQRVDIGYLDEVNIDWSGYSWTTPGVLPTTGPKQLRPHQTRALEDVRKGLAEHDRGKLVMACGTGKTFTSLRIAEDLVGESGSVLFLVPSIQLMSQSLREWMANRESDIRPFAVCSDVRVGRKASDEGDLSTIDLTEPATTDATTLARRMASGRRVKPRMTVVFATYQSIEVVAKAQAELGLMEFDLIICDEAHRTTGVTLAGVDESHFVKVHDNAYLRASKRLYMTATPRVFGDEVRRKAKDVEAVLADMSDEATYGPELHRLGFGDAVEADLLTDYKVLVLAVDEQYVAENFQTVMANSGEIALGDAAKLIGCWNGLAKNFGAHELGVPDTAPMQRAVAFAKDIKASKQAAVSFPAMVERALQDESEGRHHLRVEAAHVDGTMGIHERNAHLAWLKDEPPAGVCRVLTNARCLSEGVDVPALDAVLFLTPRGSQVDVVQSVGRVMRKAPGKQFGYIILPIVVPSGVAPEEALRDNERYRVVWQVLQALRSHDERFHAMVNQIELNKRKSSRLSIIDVTPRPPRPDQPQPDDEQLALDYGFDGFRDAMYARIVKKVGERKYWETWAKDVADIAQTHIIRIKGLLADPDSNPAREFAEFLSGLRGNLNEGITAEEAIEMLAQHIITRPIFDAVFDDYDFALHNPVAQTMELMLASLDERDLVAEQASLDSFYASVRRRAEGLDNVAAKQRVIVELYDKFFATAFKRTVDRLGIVYTPVEIVDFILQSADQVLREEFGQGLTDKGVHVLDGFTGTGTFIARLLTSDLIEPRDLARKYASELHANEIMLLAYYLAAVNIETTYAAVREELSPVLGLELDEDGEAVPTYETFPGLVLTDTFQSYEDGDRDDLDIFPENNERITRQRALPITVIVGNPPYSVGQDSANDDNANTKYPTIDTAIRETYAARSTATLKNSLYDSYVRALKWASLRLGDRGVIAFVTNGGFLDANTADGLRQVLAEEFSTIHVFNLRGNARTAGEMRQKEGGTVFDAGSRATVAITVLVRNPIDPAGDPVERARIRYTDIGDYLTREEKLARIADAGGIAGLDPVIITPNEHGDWLSQRSGDFNAFYPLGDKATDPAVFRMYSGGLKTNRDAWNYNSSHRRLEHNVRSTIGFYNDQISAAERGEEIDRDATRISWDRVPLADVRRGRTYEYRPETIQQGQYRPFVKTWVYPHRQWNNTVYQLPRMFPTPAHENVGIYQVGAGSAVPFSVLMLDAIPDLHVTGAGSGGQFFARWTWEPVDVESLDLGDEGEVIDGYRRADNLTEATLARFQAAYGPEWTKDDVFYFCYGLLHSPDYRETYAADLKKMLPRIPLLANAADAHAFAQAGRALSELHLSYESVEPYPLHGLDVDAPAGNAAYDVFAVGAKKMRFGDKGKDRSVLHYNDRILLSGIPEEAYRYQLGSRSAIEWIIDRYYVKTDKASGIVNDPNDWSREVGDPRYILDLIARIVTVSVGTVGIVDSLPALVVREDQ